MIRLLRTVVLAGAAVAFAACAESSATAPQRAPVASAAGDVVGFAAPSPSVTCTWTQVDATHYQATAKWSGISMTGLEFLQGTTVLYEAQFHPTRNGNVTATLFAAPDVAILSGKPGAKVLCSEV